jgi:hypothetical protein
METFTLVVWLWLTDVLPYRESLREARTPGLSEDECKAAAKLVAPPQGDQGTEAGLGSRTDGNLHACRLALIRQS